MSTPKKPAQVETYRFLGFGFLIVGFTSSSSSGAKLVLVVAVATLAERLRWCMRTAIPLIACRDENRVNG